METSHLRLGEILIEAGVLKPAQLERALELQKKRRLRLGMLLLQEKIVTEPQLIQALSRRLSIPWVSLWHLDIEDSLLELVPVSVAEEFFLVPIYIRTTGVGEKALYVAMNDPMDDAALRFVAASAGMSVKPMIAAPSDIATAIRLYYYDEEEPSEEPPPPIPQSSSGNMTALPPPVSPDHKSRSKPPEPPVRSSPPPPPKKDEEIEEIEEIEELEELESDDLTPEDADSDAPDTKQDEEETDEETDEEPSDEEEEARGDDESESSDESDPEQLTSRDIEKHMFGVGGAKSSGISLTLLDGTQIQFGDGSKQTSADSQQGKLLTKESLVAGLRAAAAGEPIDGILPSTKWEDYMAALLEVLFRKHLVFFEEYLEALNKKK